MIGIVFNHDVFDDPYKQSDVKKGFDRLDALCKKLNEHLFTSFSEVKRSGLMGKDRSDDYVVVHHTSDLSPADKAALADCIKQTLTVKRTEYKENELPEICIVFVKISQEDFYCFNVKQ